MCKDTSRPAGRRGFDSLEEITADRRTLLKVAGAGGASYLFSSAFGAPPAAAAVRRKRRAYVIVLDGCRPDEVAGNLMPTVKGLRDQGLFYPRASSLPIMETIPNHVMMMTGVRPDRSGVPANSIYDRELGEIRDVDRPGDIRFPTVIQRLNRRGFTTGTVLSKEYLYTIFGKRPTHRWEPSPIVPVSGHAPDEYTMDAAIEMVRQFDPNLVFISLGDVDRMGHSDVTGTTRQEARATALRSTDGHVARFVSMLKETGRWRSSMLIFLADHSMDWSRPERVISLAEALEADPMLAGRVEIAQNGGANLLYWTGPATQRQAAVDRMRSIALGLDGVLAAHDRAATRWLRLGPRVGDVVCYCRSGWRFSDPTPFSNPIPGNHGHPATRPIPFFIAGGHRLVPRGQVSSRHAHTIDVAPTVGEYFGLRPPRGGYDGRSRL